MIGGDVAGEIVGQRAGNHWDIRHCSEDVYDEEETKGGGKGHGGCEGDCRAAEPCEGEFVAAENVPFHLDRELTEAEHESLKEKK